MSRSYDRSHDHAWFAITILIVCAIWAHRDILPTIEHIAILALLLVVIVIFITCVIRVIRKVLRIFRVDKTTIEEVDGMSGLEFEKYVAILLKKQGYSNVILTEKYDFGVDIIAEKDGIRWGIQVKRYSGLVKANAVRQVVAALKIYNCDRAMVITNNNYSQTAKKLAESNDCTLIDKSILLRWI